MFNASDMENVGRHFFIERTYDTNGKTSSVGLAITAGKLNSMS